MTDTRKPEGCPDRDRIGLYLDDALGAEERGELEAHLASCRDCRRQLVAAHEERKSLPEVGVPRALVEEMAAKVPLPKVATGKAAAPGVESSNRGSDWLPMAAALLLGLGLVLLWPGRFDDPGPVQEPIPRGSISEDPSGETLRSSSTVTDEPTLLAPAEGAMLAAPVIELSWAALAEVRRYELRIFDGSGKTLFETSTSEPGVEVDSGKLPAGDCFWYVVVVLEDGRRLESPSRHFRIGEGFGEKYSQ